MKSARTRVILFCVALSAIGAPASADLPTEQLAVSTAGAGTGQHAEATAPSSAALEAVRASIAESGYSAPRLLALGRAQREAGQLGAAIASFERGRLLEPRDVELYEALDAARAEAGVPAAAESRWSRAAKQVSLREWAYLGLACAFASALLLIGIGISQRQRRRLIGVLAGVLLLGGLSVVGFTHVRGELARAIVLVDGTAVRLSPFAKAATMTELRAGEALGLTTDRHEGFLLVEHASGVRGWVAADAIAPLGAAPLSPPPASPPPAEEAVRS